MTKKKGITLRMKYIRAGHIDSADFKGVVVNKDVLEMIKIRDVASLKDLTRENPQEVLHRLARDYWKHR